jgi:histone acetyltransferase MYST1
MTLPTHQQKGYGRLLIELSKQVLVLCIASLVCWFLFYIGYELSKSEGKIGSPEKPLSPLGNLGYQSYWASTIISLLLHFRGDVTISEICKGTCIHEEDVIGTLSRLGLLRYRKQKSHIQHIFVTQEMIDEALVKFNIKLGRKLDPENIRWK